MFSKKLNFLMDLTKSKNSVLANAVSLDASHISRLRHGDRRLPKRADFLAPMAAYFARQIRAEYQKHAACDALGVPAWPADEMVAAQYIQNWLAHDDQPASSVQYILERLSAPSGIRVGQPPPVPPSDETQVYYYGVGGKREAVVRFLRAVNREQTPQTLLLYSEEEMGWLCEDPGFSKQWAMLLTGALMRGNRIRIIHTVNRNLNELLEAVAKWVPVYLTGMIESYYYPKLRDGVFQRTLFLAPKTAAVVSTSVKQDTMDMLHFYVEDPMALHALKRDYDNYLALCRPLMQVFERTNASQFWNLFHEFEQVESETIVLRPGLSVMTMPESVAQAMAARSENGARLLKLHASGAAVLEQSIQENRFCELIGLPDPETLLGDAIPLPTATLLDLPGLCYTRDEYRQHLEHVLALMERYPRYCVRLCNDVLPGLLLYGKEGVGMLMAKTEAPWTTFAFSEPNMTAGFWDHLMLQKNRTEQFGAGRGKQVLHELLLKLQ